MFQKNAYQIMGSHAIIWEIYLTTINPYFKFVIYIRRLNSALLLQSYVRI